MGTRRGDRLIGYIDGVETCNVVATTSSIANTVNVGIGGRPTGDTVNFPGSLDDVRIYNRSLSTDEAKRLYQMGEGTKINTTITPPNLQTGLVGHWTFDGPDMQWQTTGAEVRDISGQGNHGAIMGGMTNRSGTEGVIGQGMSFDGFSDHVNIGDQPSLDITGDLTVAGWVKTTDNYGTFFNKYTYTNSKGYLLWFYNSGQIIQFTINGIDGRRANISATPYLDNKWHHIVGVCKDTEPMRIYVDGVEAAIYLVQDNCEPITSAAGLPAKIAERSQTGEGDGRLEGKLDDIRVYNRSLSAEEVKQLYRLGARE